MAQKGGSAVLTPTLAHLVSAPARQCPGRIMPPPLVRLLRDTEAAPRAAVAGVAKTASLSAASVPEAEARPATLSPILAAMTRPASSRPAAGAWASAPDETRGDGRGSGGGMGGASVASLASPREP